MIILPEKEFLRFLAETVVLNVTWRKTAYRRELMELSGRARRPNKQEFGILVGKMVSCSLGLVSLMNRITN